MLVSVAVAICCFFLVRFTQLPTLGGRVIKADITGTSANLSEVSTTLTEGDTDDYDWSDDQRHVGRLSVSDLDDDNPGKRSDRHSVSCVATYMLIKPKSTIHFWEKDSSDELGNSTTHEGTRDAMWTAIPFPHLDDLPANQNAEGLGTTTTRGQLRVHFRPRVRITSGIRRQHRSVDSSASSSISAPLRYGHGNDSPRPDSPFGSVGTYVYGDYARGKIRRHKQPNHVLPPGKKCRYNGRRGDSSESSETMDERTTLTSSNGWRRANYYRSLIGDVEDASDGQGRRREERTRQSRRRGRPVRKSDEDVFFGKWSQRLLNHHVRINISSNAITSTHIDDVSPLPLSPPSRDWSPILVSFRN